MRQVTISVSDEKYASFIEMMLKLDYVQLDENTFHVSDEQMKYVLDIKAKTKQEDMIDSDHLFDELDKKYL
jgi:hypothetical protein